MLKEKFFGKKSINPEISKNLKKIPARKSEIWTLYKIKFQLKGSFIWEFVSAALAL